MHAPTLRSLHRRSISLPRWRRSSSRSSAASASASAFDADAITTNTNTAIQSIVRAQPSVRDMEDERRDWARGLDVLEPRPCVYWAGVEERMGSF